MVSCFVVLYIRMGRKKKGVREILRVKITGYLNAATPNSISPK